MFYPTLKVTIGHIAILKNVFDLVFPFKGVSG
jgi:hypothetical protein